MANTIQRSVIGSTVAGLVPNTVIKCNISNGIADCNTTQMTLSSNKQRFDSNLDQLRAIRAELESQRFSYDNGMWKDQADYPLSPFAALSPMICKLNLSTYWLISISRFFSSIRFLYSLTKQFWAQKNAIINFLVIS